MPHDSVVDDNVDRAKPRHAAPDHSFDSANVAQIGAIEGCLVACVRREPHRSRLPLARRRQSVENDLRAGSREAFGDGTAEPRSRACHQCALFGKHRGLSSDGGRLKGSL